MIKPKYYIDWHCHSLIDGKSEIVYTTKHFTKWLANLSIFGFYIKRLPTALCIIAPSEIKKL